MNGLVDSLESQIEEARLKKEAELAALKGTSKEPGITEAERLKREHSEAKAELVAYLEAHAANREKLRKTMLRHLDFMQEEDDNYLDGQVLEENLQEAFMTRDSMVGEARFVQELVQGALKAPGANKALMALLGGLQKESDVRSFSRLVSCMPILGERTPQQLAFLEDSAAEQFAFETVPLDVRTGKDKKGYCNLMAKLRYQEEEAISVVQLYEYVLGMAVRPKQPWEIEEEEEEAGPVLRALGVSLQGQKREQDVLKVVGGKEAIGQMGAEEQANIMEFVTEDNAEKMKQKADDAEEEALFYEGLVRGALRVQGIMNFIEARDGKEGAVAFGNFIRNLPALAELHEQHSAVVDFTPAPALCKEEITHLNAAESTEAALERKFMHEERLIAAELRYDQAKNLISMLEQVIQTEYDHLCTDSEGSMLPEVKLTLDDIHAKIKRHREQRRLREQGLAVADESAGTTSPATKKEDFGSTPAILQIDSTLTNMSLQMAQGDDAGLVELSKMKDDIKATQENPHAFGRGEDPGAPKPGERIPTPRKYNREDFLPPDMKEMVGGDRSHLGTDFWQNAPLEYVKSGKRSPSARGRHIPVESPKLLLVNPEVTRMGAYQDDYKSMGTSIRSDSRTNSRASQRTITPTQHSQSRVTYDLQNVAMGKGTNNRGQQLEGLPRPAWPEQAEYDMKTQEDGRQALPKPGWDPSIPRTLPTSLPATPIERHRTMTQMLSEQGKASSPLKARQQMMQSVNADVQERMSMLMNSVGYGEDGNHLTQQIVAEGNMAMDDNMSQMADESEWLNQAKHLAIEPQPWELPPQQRTAYHSKVSILPGIEEQNFGPTSGAVRLPPTVKKSELTSASGESLEFCLERWNSLGMMVDTMTSASRTLARLDRKYDTVKDEEPIGSQRNPSEKAIKARTKRRNSRVGDPNWGEW